MFRRASGSLLPLFAVCAIAAQPWLGGCAPTHGPAETKGGPAAQRAEYGSAGAAPVSVTPTAVDDTSLPLVQVRPSTAQGRGAPPRVAIVGAEQQSRLEPVRRRPEPLLYGLLTGHEPFVGETFPGRHRRVRTYTVAQADSPLGDSRPLTREEIEREAERSQALEARIQEELEHNERLLRDIQREEEAPAGRQKVDERLLSERADPRAAPETPAERSLPRAIFDEDKLEIPRGDKTWKNASRLEITRRTLDADQDGHAEQIRYYTRKDDVLMRIEKDRNFDGRIDTWDRYEDGKLTRRALDSNDDGLPDTWEEFDGTHMTGRVIDRDHDGARDAWFIYRQGSLIEERHDPDNDGEVDLVSTFEQRRRINTREDRSGDGAFDTWTTYRIVMGRELPSRIERDTLADGKPNVFETYIAIESVAVLSEKEEDNDGDGQIDITSFYENGKLKRREISDPSLLP